MLSRPVTVGTGFPETAELCGELSLYGVSEPTDSSLRTCSAADFLKQLEWSKSAPKQLVRAAKSGEVQGFVIAYRCLLEPVASRFRKRLTNGPSSLALCSDRAANSLAALVEIEFTGGDRFGLGRAVRGWLDSHGAVLRVAASDRALAMQLLLDSPIDLEVESWFRLFRYSLMWEANQQCATDVLQALLFSPLRGAAKQQRLCGQRLSEALLGETDSDGTPHARLSETLDEWFAGYVVPVWWARCFKREILTDPAHARLKQVARRCAERIRADGSFACTAPGRRASDVNKIAIPATRLSRKSTHAALLSGKARKRNKGESEGAASSQSDWAEVAVLRSDSGRGADVLVCAFDRPEPVFELSCFGVPILSGAWNTQVRIGSRKVRPESWECSCWYSDRDGTYLELTANPGEDCSLERHLYLSAGKRFALLMDCVTTPGTAAVSYESSIPTHEAVMSRADFVSREWRLHSGEFPVRVLPISLAFDRVQSASGECLVQDGQLQLRSAGKSTACFAVALDWHQKRTEAPAEWTGLTVTESRQAVDQTAALAYRVRIGRKHQLVVYKNLNGSRELRSVLGQHTGRESFVGSVKPGGKFEPLVLVEFADE